MNTKVKLTLAASIVLGGAGLLAGSASAMPMNGLNAAVETTTMAQDNVQEAAWVCRPWGCHWRPNWGYYGYGYGGWHGGWHGGWNHWHHWHHR